MVFKQSDVKSFIDLIKETKENSGGFKDFVQGFKDIGSVNLKSLDISKLNRYIDSFNNYNKDGTLDKNFNTLISKVKALGSDEITNAFEQFAKSGDKAKISLEDMLAIGLNGNTKGLKNVKGIINDFNKLADNKNGQEALAKAVGQTNYQFGEYLENIKDGKASLGGYVKQLAATTARTIELQLATVVLNMAITAVVGLAVAGIAKVVNQMNDLKKEIDNLEADLNDTRSEIESINSTLDENKKKIDEINSAPLDITDEDTLKTLQLENAELERQKKLLEEIEKQKAKELSDKTAQYLNKKSELNTDGGYWKSVLNNILRPDSFADDFKQIFDKNTTWGEKILNIGKFISPLGDVADTFIPETRSILDETEAFQNELDERFSEIEGIFGKGISSDTDFSAFSDAVTDINELRNKLTTNIDVLNTYKGTLNETSDEYKIVSEQLDRYLSQLETLNAIEPYDTSGLTDEYFKIREKFDKGFNAYLLGVHDNQNIDSSVLDLLGEKTDINENQQYALTGNYIDQFEQARKVLDTLKGIELDRELTFDESRIKSVVESYYNALDKEIQEHGEDFSKGKSSEANNIFANYIANSPIEDITAETYDKWCEGLLKQAQDDTAIKDILKRMINGISLDMAEAIDNKPFETTTQSLSELKESIDSTFANQSTIQSAFDKIKEGSALSDDEVRSLIELYPKLSSEFTKTADGYTIDSQKLIDANDSIVESTKQALQERADYLKEFINTDYNTDNINGAFEAKKYGEWQKSVSSAKSELEGLELVLSMFGLTAEDTSVKLEELIKSTSDIISKAKTLSSAFAEQNKNGKLSSDTILSLIENGYSAVLMYDKKTGAVKLNAQAYLDLANAEIQSQIAEVSLAKMNDTSMQDKLNAQREIVSNLGWSYLDTAEAALKMAEAQEIINNADADLSKYDAQMAALRELKESLGSVVEGEYGNTGSSPSSSKPKAITDFEREYADIQHEIAMGRKEKDEDYYSWLEKRSKEVYTGLAEYQDELYRYEEEVYDGRKKLAEDLFNEQQKLFENQVSDIETRINVTTDKNEDSEGNKLDTKEKFDYIRDGYQEIINITEARINEIIQAGIEGHEDLVAELEKDIESYKEKLADVFKSEVEEEQDLIQKRKESYSDLYDERINKIKEQQKASEEASQAEIDAVQEKIDALKKSNEKEQEANDIIEARQKLEKAKQRTRAVYGADGSISYKADPDKVNEAQEELDKLLNEQQISILEEQKETLESVKDKQSEAYDAIIENLESEKEAGERRFDVLLNVLEEYLKPENSTSNSEVWSELAKIEGAKYQNGIWTDKDGNAIDLDGLLKSSEAKADDKEKNGNSNDNNAELHTKERLSFGSETENTENEVKDNTKSVVDSFFAMLEKEFNLETGSLTAEKIQQTFGNAPITSYTPYSTMTGETELANKEYVSNNSQRTDFASTFTGDIVINNPVGNSNDLAKELMMNLPNAFQRQIYTNMRR